MEILILGGGAAGLMAAICAKERNPGAKVTILEAGERVGKKLLSTGNGRCNLTNVGAAPISYAPAKGLDALIRMPPARVMEKFEGMGLVLRTEAEGRVYPASDAASSVLDTLRLTAEHLGAGEVTDFCAVRARAERGRFILEDAGGRRASGDRLILAAGGRAASKRTGYDLARDLGHSVTPLRPGLLPVKTDGAGIKGLNGVRVKCAATLLAGERAVLREEGEVLFKDFGLSGVAVFQLSRQLARQGSGCEVELDLLPHLSEREAGEFLRARAARLAWRGTDAFFLGMFHKNVARNLLEAAGVGPGPVGAVAAERMDRLARIVKRWRHKVVGTPGFESAQVTVGGVPMDEVEARTLSSRVCPGLYFAGEILDVDGPCGGYNLNWAWASGAAAGESAAKEG
jgi:predicted Rossmann fold flavoprotein